MTSVNILSLPKIMFAHVYKANTYSNSFNKRENFLEITYVEEGFTSMKIADKIFLAKKGDVICNFYNHATLVNAPEFHCHHTVGATVEFEIVNSDLEYLLLPTITPSENDTTKICNMIDSLIQKQNIYKNSTVKSAAKFLDLLCEIDNCNRKAENSNLPSELIYIKRAKDYVQRNIQNPITQTSVAEYLGISSGYLCSIFKKSEHSTLMQYINKSKLENIKSLMDNKNMHLYEASALFGYSDPNYVSRLFKKIYGYNITDKLQVHPEII